MGVKITVDRDVDAAYIELSEGAVVRTVHLESGFNVDLDAMEMVVGIEVLALGADLPLARLQEQFHVSVATIHLLQLLRPTLAYFLSKQSAEGSSSRVEQTVGIPV